MKNLLLTLLAVTVLSLSFAQAQDSKKSEVTKAKKELSAHRTQNAIKVNGELDEFDWANSESAVDFVQNRPNPGSVPTNKTDVKIMYDNQAIYLAARMYEDPSKISKQLTERDGLSNTDWFGIILSPYQDGINGVGFIVTSAGVQFDTKYSAFGEDEEWDAVWKAETNIVEDGWILEMEIPYSAIRFPNQKEQNWDVNFVRFTNSTQEKSFWSEVDPTINGFLNQTGTLKGITDIKSPVRLQATPFLATYAQHYNDKDSENPQSAWGKSFNAGMDIKYGLSDAFTLDMTLIPDFGEAASDNQVLNLTQFEVRFDENRQFFTEGTELFNKGGLFYSRRIGGSPMHYAGNLINAGDTILSEPAETQLYNATKISGRTSSGTGLGIFNAVVGATNATVQSEDGVERQVQTNPLTNYNVLVVDQNLKNNSFVTLINTNVMRNGSDYDANATGLIFNLRNKKESYRIRGDVKVSQQFFSDNNAYTNHVSNNLFITDKDLNDLLDNPDQKVLLGHAFNLGASKISGNFNFGAGYGQESHTYDINDLGFLYNNNEQDFDFWAEYGHYKPFGKFNRMGGGIWSGGERIYKPNKFSEFGINGYWWAQTKNFWNLNVWFYTEPFLNGNDYFEPRTPGRFVKDPKMGNIGLNFNTDGRKKFVFHFNTNGGKGFDLYETNWGSVSMMGVFRVSDRFNFRMETRNIFDHNDLGYVAHSNDDIILGKRDQRTMINSIWAGYNFNKNMNLNFRLRHYWSAVKYNEFNSLAENGELESTDYNEFNDLSFNFFNIDMIYRWRFAPGSDIFFVWKNATNNVSGDQDLIQYDYRKGVRRLGDFPQNNSFSLKIIYFLDYLSLTRK